MQPGDVVGPYRIVGRLGAGGMGEVYRARDTTLNRDVAIKVLPAAVAADADRLARFRREAQVLASLNHPNIGAIYGVEDAGGVPALVLELVEGPTLADRIAAAPSGLPLEEALAIARQIVDALDAAHEQGIVHRDLKPANIKVRDDGTVKVLDFGLAKAVAEPNEQDVAAATSSPTTIPSARTDAGMILGTAAYMSPEQAKGRPADKRGDIWAFGCVLYEMLTGTRAFPGDSVTESLAAVLRAEPDASKLPHDTPQHVGILVARALRKDPRQRLGDVAVARFLLTEGHDLPLGHAVATGVRSWRWRWSAIAAGLFALTAAAALGWRSWRPVPPAALPVVRFSIPIAEYSPANTARPAMALSADGQQMVFAVSNRLYLRRLSELETRPIPGIDALAGQYSVGTVQNPMFSPDGRSIVFYYTGGGTAPLLRIGLEGGTPVSVCPTTTLFGMSWFESDLILGLGSGGIARCSTSSGQTTPLLAGESGIEMDGPQLLTDGDSLIFAAAVTADGLTRWDKANIVLYSLKSGTRRTLVAGGSHPQYLPSGHLLFVRGGLVYAATFDPKSATVGEPAIVIEGVRRPAAQNTGAAQLAVSPSGVMAYVPGPILTTILRRVAIADRAGAVSELIIDPGPYEQVRVSRDGRHLAIATSDGSTANIFVHDLGQAAALRRLTLSGRNRHPAWSADGRRLAYQSDRDGDLAIFWQRADGSGRAERLSRPGPNESHIPESFSADGKTLSLSILKDGRYSLATLAIAEQKLSPLGVTTGEPPESVFSPDGRWIAYAMNGEPARPVTPAWGVFVQPFPATGDLFQAPKSGRDFHPVWNGPGELLYVPSAVSARMAVLTFSVRPTAAFGAPTLIPARVTADRRSSEYRSFDVLPDGRFVGLRAHGSQNLSDFDAEIRVTVNWFDQLKRRLPPR